MRKLRGREVQYDKHRAPSQERTAALPQASFPTLKGSQMATSQYRGTPPILLAKSQPKAGIDQSPGASPRPPEESWELSHKPDPRGDGRTEARRGGTA